MSTSPPPVGELLRTWRQRRNVSQFRLATSSAVSARHLSFIETGRARPSREMVIHLAERLDVPLRERNSLLLAAGYAPVYRQTDLQAAEMTSVREALDKVLAGHEPYPAVVADARWNLVTANRAALSVLVDGVAPQLLEPPANVLRACLHPEGLAPRIANLGEFGGHLLDRLRRQIAASADPELAALYDELRAYAGAEESSGSADPAALLFVPLVLRVPGGPELTFFSTVATFGTALDITIAELVIESFFPADERTASWLQAASS